MLRSSVKSLVAAGLCVGLCGFHCSTLIAQESVTEETMEIQMAVDDESGGAPVVISSSRMMFAGEGEGGESSFQIFTGSDMGGDWIPGGSGVVDPLSLLGNEGVREELDLVDDQLDKFRDAQKELQEQIADKAKSLAGGKLNPAQMGEIAMEIAELQKGKQQKLESMLLPHQLERLKQVALQVQMKNRGTANTLLSDAVTEELGIDSAQKKRIEERQKELKKELAERMAELKAEIRDKLLSELTAEQQAKLKDLSGDDFEYKPMNINEQIQEKLNRRIKRRRIGG